MHELSLAMNVVEIVADRVAEGDIERVHVVHVEVGALTCVEPTALAFAFDVAKLGSPAERATLLVHPRAARACCNACDGPAFGVESHGEPCPTCGSFDVELRAGMELRVSELEVD